jgi:hypothetical protein
MRNARGNGFATLRIWGFYEFANAALMQPDGRIVVGGNAADPAYRWRINIDCYPALCQRYPALVRLNADGSLDRSFNETGKIVLAGTV